MAKVYAFVQVKELYEGGERRIPHVVHFQLHSPDVEPVDKEVLGQL